MRTLNNTTRSTTRWISSLTAALAVLVAPNFALAQLQVRVELERDSYITQEATVATVTVENRAGKDIVLGGPSGGSWLMMDVREVSQQRPEGRMVSARNGAEPKPSTVLLKDGESTRRKIDLQAYYTLESGQYAVGCSVYFSDLDRWVGPVRPTSVLITSPRTPFFEQTVGVTEVVNTKGSYRRYKLFSCPTSYVGQRERATKNMIFVQICDEVSEETLSIFPLGELMKYYPPQPTVDPANNLHVLYQTGPKLWAHAVVNAKGTLLDFEQHEAVDSSRPELMKNQQGTIAVKGGRVYDPRVEALLAKARAKDQRNLSDRPEGLPEERKKP